MTLDATLFSAMAGSLLGASATVGATWITQRTLARRELMLAEMRKREALYGDFIAECTRLFMDAFTHALDKPEKLLNLHSLINRIRLVASAPVLEEAEQLLRRITEQYFSPNLTLEEMRELALSTEADPLRSFASACRVELHAMTGQA